MGYGFLSKWFLQGCERLLDAVCLDVSAQVEYEVLPTDTTPAGWAVAQAGSVVPAGPGGFGRELYSIARPCHNSNTSAIELAEWDALVDQTIHLGPRSLTKHPGNG